MLAVISPSKTQDFSSSNVDVFTKMRQIEQSQILIDLLKTKTQSEIASLMSISDKLSKLNFDRFQTFSTPFTLTNAKQALLAFKGDVYNGIDAPNLSSQDLDFAQSCVR
ncbi:MAG: peroxide stress protein YaaA, partial [Candidatus Thioglobus sp.]|nr:peroxide stress protein YaaA [Candidatus Thioglobus sp.]